MKFYFKNYFVLLLSVFLLQSCSDDDDKQNVPDDIAVQDFVWKGMNLYYLWQDDVPDLADDRFSSQEDLNQYLKNYPDPIQLFDDLRIDHALDRFSVIYSDYTVLEGVINGTSRNNGVDFGLRYKSGSDTEIFGWVRYILPNSDASTKDIQRGDIFYAINGMPLSVTNYQSLLANETYTLNLADYNNGAITPNGQSVTVTKGEYSENPVLVTNVINSGNHKIGYLLYNGFYAGYENELNAAFGQLKSQNITDLVLDLRYNSGGSIATATRLASMITGQFSGQLFAKEEWNDKAESYFEANNPDVLRNNFTTSIQGGAPIHSLNLNRVYVLTTKSTASASELVINGLAPYIDVVQIGEFTTGKNVGSITLYDSPNFGKEDRSDKHKYAMQPIVLRIVNNSGFGDYLQGLAPDVPLNENFNDLGNLGSEDETFLSAAIAQITGAGRMHQPDNIVNFDYFKDSKSINPLQNQMYRDTPPDYIKSIGLQ